MLRRLLLLAALLAAPAVACAQGSLAKCTADPKFLGCYPFALSPVRTNVLVGAVGDLPRTFTIAQVLQQMLAADVTTALGYTPPTLAQAAAAAPVQSVANLTGSPTVAQIQTALGLASAAYQPSATFYPASNPNGFVTSAQAAAAAPVQSVAGLTGAPTVSQMQTALALGSAAYQASVAFYASGNPSGFVTSSGAASAAPVQSVAGLTGAPTVSQVQTALGLGSAAYTAALSAGTAAGTYAAGNDARITGALAASTAASTYLPLAGGTLSGNLMVSAANAGSNRDVQVTNAATTSNTAARLIALTGTANAYTVVQQIDGATPTSQIITGAGTTGGIGVLTSAGPITLSPASGLVSVIGAVQPTTAMALGYGGTGATSASAARVNLGLGGAAVLNVGTATGTVAAGDDARITAALPASMAASTYTPLTTVNGTGSTLRGRTGTLCRANGTFSTAGDAQTCVTILRVATASTAAARLTTDGAAAGAANCLNIPANAAYRLRIDLVGLDVTAPTTNLAQARWDDLILLRGAAASTTGVAGTGAATQQGNGTMAGTAVAYGIGADTTNGCLILQVTPVNAISTHWVARVTTVEVQ